MPISTRTALGAGAALLVLATAATLHRPAHAAQPAAKARHAAPLETQQPASAR